MAKPYKTVIVPAGCNIPELYEAVTVNAQGMHPRLAAKAVGGLGPPLIWDAGKKLWKNFHNERVQGRLIFQDWTEIVKAIT